MDPSGYSSQPISCGGGGKKEGPYKETGDFINERAKKQGLIYQLNQVRINNWVIKPRRNWNKKL